MKQQLYASVYSSQGTMEQLLISRTIQLLNSEEELVSVQQLQNEMEAEVKKISVQGGQILENQTKLQKFTEKEKERKAELQKIEGLFYHLLQEKDTELQEVIQLQQVQDTQYLQGIKLYFVC